MCTLHGALGGITPFDMGLGDLNTWNIEDHEERAKIER